MPAAFGDVMYEVLKFLHVLGVIILVGNVTITAFWKVFADMSRVPSVIAHAQDGVIFADWIFTLTGIVLILVGGFGAAYVAGMPMFGLSWLVVGEILFAVSGLIWIGILIPLQIRQARAARAFRDGGQIPDGYWRDARAWLVWGVIATVPLVAAIYVMIVKP